MIRIKRTANFGRSPENVLRARRQMPGREIISMFAQHPEVVRRMDGSAQHPFPWMAGLECLPSGYKRRIVLDAWFDADDSKLIVNAHDGRDVYSRKAVPEFYGV